MRRILALSYAAAIVGGGCGSGLPGSDPDGTGVSGNDKPWVSTTVDAQGQAVSLALSSGVSVLIEIPPGATPDTTSVMLSEPQSLRPVSSAEVVPLPGRAVRVDLGHTLSLPGTVTMPLGSPAGAPLQCLVAYDNATGNWYVPLQLVTANNQAVTGYIYGTSLLSVAAVQDSDTLRQKATSAMRPAGSDPATFTFGSGGDSFSVTNEFLDSCWGFSHYSAWYFANHRGQPLYDKYNSTRATSVAQEAQKVQSNIRAGFGPMVVRNLLAATGLTQDLVTIAAIKVHLALGNSPAALALYTEDGLLDSTWEVIAGEGSHHMVGVYSCRNGEMLIYDSNYDDAQSIRYSILGGIEAYNSDNHRYEAFVYDPRLPQYDRLFAEIYARFENTALDSDADGTPDDQDGCPNDPNKTAPGTCGCGKAETPGCGSTDPNPDVPGTVTLDLDGGVKMDLILIPAGTFQMGDISGVGWPAEQPVHTVTISRAFYIGKYEVTQAQYEAVMGTNPSHFTGDLNRPVDTVSWNDCQSFCQATLIKAGRAVRLPTKAEWEYACRADTSTDYYYGNDAGQLGNYAWYDANSSDTTHVVGQKTPNAWGLYDMAGNVWEWCNDWYGAYSAGAQRDPTGPASGNYGGVLRGGSWIYDASRCRVAYRYRLPVSHGDDGIGFRLALDSP